MKKMPLRRRPEFIPSQSDLVIDVDGTLHVSFLSRDFGTVVSRFTGMPEPDFGQGDDSYNARNQNSFNIEEKHWTRLESVAVDSGDYRSCSLCPIGCGFNRLRLRHARCGDASLRVSNVAISFGDEPVIAGRGGSGTIMLGGCSLSCPSCHNPEMVAGGAGVGLRQFAELCVELLESGAENVQILSPTVHFPKLKIVLRFLKDAGFPLPIVFKSSGYENVSQIQSFAGLVDVWLPDFKFGPDSQWALRAGVPNYFHVAQLAIRAMYEVLGPAKLLANGTLGRGVLVRHVEAPLPVNEKAAIDSFLAQLPKGVMVSKSSDFVRLEAE